MLKKRIVTILILSLAITILSPFFFYSYFEEKPTDLNQNIIFGGPFPFAEQTINLPNEKESYPIEIKFESPFEKDTIFKVTPFLFSLFSYFLFLFAFYTIIRRFFTKPIKVKEPE